MSTPSKAVKTASTRGPIKATTVEDYMDQVPPSARGCLEKLRHVLRSAAPKQAVEYITYGMPGFEYKGALIAYGAFKQHCSLFPMGSSALEEFAEELADYRTSKGTLQLPYDKPLPVALLKRIVRACVERNEARGAKRGSKSVAGTRSSIGKRLAKKSQGNRES